MLSVRALCVAAVVVALAVTHAAAWGNVGHQVTAAVAQNLLSKRANDAVTKILDGQTMETVSTWADDVKHTSQYAWSAPLHYVDAQDKMCNFDYTRDCWDHEMTPETSPNACVAGAITNYTKRASASLRALMSNRITHHHTQRVNGQKVQGDDETSREQLANAASVNEALKFLIHFLGDIHQPLHVAFAGDRGGNEITVYFYGYKENLHAVWDEWIISRLLTDFFGGSQNSWTAALTNQIQNGNFSDAAKQWAQCNDGSTACTTSFANESITYACNSAYECIPGSDTPCDTQRVVDGSRLDDDYFYNTYPVVHQRIAQGGVRLAALLNNLFG